MIPIAAYRTSSPPSGETLSFPSSLEVSAGRTRVLNTEAAIAKANGASSSRPALQMPVPLYRMFCQQTYETINKSFTRYNDTHIVNNYFLASSIEIKQESKKLYAHSERNISTYEIPNL